MRLTKQKKRFIIYMQNVKFLGVKIMTKDILELIAGAGAGTIVSVLLGYFWLKDKIVKHIVQPELEKSLLPIKSRIEILENHNQEVKESLNKIDNTLSMLTKSVAKLSIIFDILSKKIDITIKN